MHRVMMVVDGDLNDPLHYQQMRLNFRILAEQIAGRMNWAKCTVSNAVSNAEKYEQCSPR